MKGLRTFTLAFLILALLSSATFAVKDNPHRKNTKVVIEEVVAEPVAEPVTEPVAELVTEPVAELVTEPVAELVTEPVAELVTVPVAEPVTEPVAEPVTEPIIDGVTSTSEFFAEVASISDGSVIYGTTGAMLDLNGQSLKLENLNNVEFNNLNFVNAENIQVNASNSVRFVNCTFDGFTQNGIELSGATNVTVTGCTFINIGNESVNPTWQGCAIYVHGGADGLTVTNNDMSYTFGHGAVFVSDSLNVEISNNNFHDTFYRAIEFYGGVISGIASDNEISDIGSINTTNSGVGANGIFGSNADLYGMTISGNTIINVLENGIEGKYGLVENNYINGTGVDYKNHPTPSTEGIYANGLIYRNNTIINSHVDAIKVYSTSEISNLQIIGNTITDTNNANKGIFIMSEVGYSNLVIKDNIVDGYDGIIYLHNDDISLYTFINNILL